MKLVEKLRSAMRERAAAWVLRRQGPDSLPTRLLRRRIYILPTRAGVGFGLLAFTMLIAGLNYTNSLALFLTFLWGGLALVSMHQCHRNLLDVSVLDAYTSPAFAGDSGGMTIVLENDSSLARHRIEVRAFEREHAGTIDLPERSTRRIELRVRTSSRGLLRVNRFHVATTHPFGLFRAWTWVHLPLAITVYPRPRGPLPMPAQSGIEPGPRLRGGSGEDEWLSLRAFRDGDSPRQVAWKAYARGAPLLVKEYGASGAELRLFDFAKLPGLDTEARLEQLARWIVDAEMRGERYGLAIGGRRIEPDRGLEHRDRCLRALALYGLPDEPHAASRGA